ncbi:MAG: hypothetical protein ACM3NQ_24215 [Bacteroidales bacterium]
MTTSVTTAPVPASRLPLSQSALFAGFLLIALALNFWYLTGGFQADDILFLNMLRTDPLPFSRWRGAWSVAVDRFTGFTSLWWFEPGVQGSFFRPIPSLLFEGAVRVFGHAFPLHLLSIVLHAAVGFTTYLLFARLSGRRLVALLAGVIFVGCEDHSMTVGWIATMTDPLAVLFINIAVLAHLEYREHDSRWSLATEVAALALSLGCKESAVVAPIAIVLLEVIPAVNQSRAGRASTTPARGSWRLVLPSLAVLAIYVGLVAVIGVGGMRSLMYVNPVAQPLAYVRHAATTLPVMIAAVLSVVPPSTAVFTPQFLVPLAVAGAALGLLFLPAVWPLRRDVALQWALALVLLALLPQVATDASERLLYYPFVGASYVLAVLIAEIEPIARRRGAPLAPRFTRIWGWYLLGGVVLPGLVMAALMPFVFVPSLERVNRDVSSAVPAVHAHLRAHPGGTIVVLNLPGPYPTFYVGGILEHHLGQPVATRVLSALNGVMSVERVGDRSFVLRTDRGGWLDNFFARIVRLTPGFSLGRRYSNRDFDATLARLTPGGRDVLDVRFDFATALADPNLLFLSWNGERLAPIDVASLPRDTRVPLADTSDVWKSM